MNIALNMRQVFRQHNLPNTALLCLPRLQVLSAGHKLVAPVLELPIKTLEESIAVEKLPWSVNFTKATLLTLHTHNDVTQSRYVMCPSNVSATIAITSTCNPPASRNVSSLAVVLHCDSDDVTLQLRSCQVQLLVDVTSQLSCAVNKLTVSLEAFDGLQVKPQSAQSTESVQIYRPTVAQKPSEQLAGSSIMDASFEQVPADIEPIPTETFESDSFVSRGMTPSDASDGSVSHVSMSLWMQCTLPHLSLVLSSTDDNCSGIGFARL